MKGPTAEDVRRSANLLALVPRPPEPRKTARNRWQCLCPFHEDGAPSMSVSFLDFGWVFRCFACGVTGDVIGYVMRLENCSFQEALMKLTNKQATPAIPLWAPKPKAFVIPCEGKGCGALLELDANEIALADVAHPAWRFAGPPRSGRALCPRCSLRLARSRRRVEPAQDRRAA